MKRQFAFLSFALGIILIMISVLMLPVAAQEAVSDEELLARGEYLIHITGCISCHTPPKPEYNVADMSQLTVEQLKAMSLTALETLDTENSLLAGGRAFPLGPAGIIFSRNLTPDEETGLGTWTDEEIEIALRIGVSKDGSRLHPLMPYRNFYNLSRQDMSAIIAYLRSIPAVNYPEPPNQLAGDFAAPELVPPTELLETAPDGSDQIELGQYLVNVVMSCSDCHSPLDPETGAPLTDKWLAGGQPYEGPWGIIYASNITPHETGIADWTEQQVIDAITKGVRPDGRRLILMPWEDYTPATETDIKAVAAYLMSGVTAVDNEVPAPSIGDAFIEYDESAQTEVSATPQQVNVSATQTSAPNNTQALISVLIGVAIVVVVIGALLIRSRR